MKKNPFDKENVDIAWCPGCGNFGILNALKLALFELKIKPTDLVITSGIGQAPKTPQYLNTNMFNGLHGRALSVATAIKAVNPNLVVIAQSGDGDMYGEGGNHFLHTIRRNINITKIVHDNMVYGLTKGQASPTSEVGFKTSLQPQGVILDPINPIALAISQNASFVARAFSKHIEQTKEIIKADSWHKGYSFIDIFQPCVVFNKINTYEWFEEKTYYLDKKHNPANKKLALEKAFETEKLPLGIFYKEERETYEDKLLVYKKTKTPLFKRKHNLKKVL